MLEVYENTIPTLVGANSDGVGTVAGCSKAMAEAEVPKEEDSGYKRTDSSAAGWARLRRKHDHFFRGPRALSRGTSSLGNSLVFAGSKRCFNKFSSKPCHIYKKKQSK